MEIRRLRTGDGAALAAIRLRALRGAPYAFSSSVEREAAYPSDFWDARVAESDMGETGVIYGAAEEDELVGMAGGFFPDGTQETAMLWGMWVASEARRHGLGEALLEAVAAWARRHGARTLRLAVTDCEESRPAWALYCGLGFEESGEQEPLAWNESLVARFMHRSLPR